MGWTSNSEAGPAIINVPKSCHAWTDPARVPSEEQSLRECVRVIRKDRPQQLWTDAGALRHRDPQLCARSAVFLAHSHNARSKPGFKWNVTPEFSKRRSASKQPCGARTCLDQIAHIAGVVIPFTLEPVNPLSH